jgi:transposase
LRIGSGRIQPGINIREGHGFFVFRKLVDQPESGTNTSYLIDSLEITFSAKLLDVEKIREFYVAGQSYAQIARKFGVAKSVIISRLGGVDIPKTMQEKRATNPQNYRCRVPPYGYAVREGKLIPNKRELRICRLVVELMGRHGKGTSETVRELERRQLLTREGKQHWDHSSVRNIFNRWKDKI